MGRSTRRFTRERELGESENGCPLASGRRWTTCKYVRMPSGYSSP